MPEASLLAYDLVGATGETIAELRGMHSGHHDALLRPGDIHAALCEARSLCYRAVRDMGSIRPGRVARLETDGTFRFAVTLHNATVPGRDLRSIVARMLLPAARLTTDGACRTLSAPDFGGMASAVCELVHDAIRDYEAKPSIPAGGTTVRIDSCDWQWVVVAGRDAWPAASFAGGIWQWRQPHA